MSYFFKYIPGVAIAALFILSLPWLGLIALFVVLAMVVSLAVAIVYAPYRLGLALSHRRHGRTLEQEPAAAAAHIPSAFHERRAS